MGRTEETKPMYEEAMRMLSETSGRVHAITISCMCNLAMLLESQNDFEAALLLIRDICGALEETKGSGDVMTLEWQQYRHTIEEQINVKRVSTSLPSKGIGPISSSTSLTNVDSDMGHAAGTQNNLDHTTTLRLLHQRADGIIIMVESRHHCIGQYAVLSHTWGSDEEEVTYDDIRQGCGRNKTGYRKIKFCAEQSLQDGLQYFWVDTCCINKSSDTELSEAITSMHRWYENAAKCYVYLSDVQTSTDDSSSFVQNWEAQVQHSRWFTRGWALQELLTPRAVDFFSRNGMYLGNKQSLERLIQSVTAIPASALRGTPLSDYSVSERLS